MSSKREGSSNSGEEISTLFITGFPVDTRKREIHSLLRFLPQYEGCHVSTSSGLVQAFGRFGTAAAANSACETLNGICFDEADPSGRIHASMARRNMELRPTKPGRVERPSSSGADLWNSGPYGHPVQQAFNPFMMPNMGYGYGAPEPFGYPAQAFDTGVGMKRRRTADSGFSSSECDTLHVRSTDPYLSESIVAGMFSQQPGYQTIKFYDRPDGMMAFVKFSTNNHAKDATQLVQHPSMSVEFARRSLRD